MTSLWGDFGGGFRVLVFFGVFGVLEFEGLGFRALSVFWGWRAFQGLPDRGFRV